jgi:hypothetical protein
LGESGTQLHQARQKSGERLARAGWRDQQHGTAGTRLRQKFQLMRARRPTPAGEPAGENIRQRRRCDGMIEDGHPLGLARQRDRVEADAVATSTPLLGSDRWVGCVIGGSRKAGHLSLLHFVYI